MSDEQEGIRDRFQARGEQAASDFAQALIGNPMFDQAVSAAISARDRAAGAQRAAMDALNISSADEAERLERRIRSMSERLEDAEDRLDRLDREVRELRRRAEAAEAELEAARRETVETKPRAEG